MTSCSENPWINLLRVILASRAKMAPPMMEARTMAAWIVGSRMLDACPQCQATADDREEGRVGRNRSRTAFAHTGPVPWAATCDASLSAVAPEGALPKRFFLRSASSSLSDGRARF